MPQGTLKAKSATTKPKSTAHTQKQKQKSASHKITKPKDYKKAQAREMVRKGAAGLTGNLEKMLAERAGYTEMVSKESGRRRGTGLGNAGGGGKKVTGKK